MADTNTGKKTTVWDAIIVAIAVAVPLYLFDQWMREKNGGRGISGVIAGTQGGPFSPGGSYNGYDYQEVLAKGCAQPAVPVRIVEDEPCIFPPAMYSEYDLEPGNTCQRREEWGPLNENNYMMQHIYPYNLGTRKG